MGLTLGEVAADARARAVAASSTDGNEVGPSSAGSVAASPTSNPGAGLSKARAGKAVLSAGMPMLPVKSAPATPPPGIIFQANTVLMPGSAIPPGAFFFLPGWLPLRDGHSRTYWWNTVTNGTTYDFPEVAADLDPAIRAD
jgi:hypothetical protein